MGDWISEIVWGVLIATAIVWEMVGVLREKEWRIEPLTRIYRDRLMRNGSVGIFFRLAFLLFWAWLGLHWLLPLEW